MSWTIAALLGTWHGVNPAMGWLFAAALGMQERRASAVVRALPPIVLGHAASVATVVLMAAGAERVLPAIALRVAGAAILLGYAALLLRRRVHPRRVGMRLGARGLFAWSFVMASAHGAGLMLLPLVLAPSAHGAHAHHGAVVQGGVLAVHTGALLLAMTGAALVAFRLSDVTFLRRAWIDTDTLWSGALAVSGVVVLIA
jgi:hypothetical protein